MLRESVLSRYWKENTPEASFMKVYIWLSSIHPFFEQEEDEDINLHDIEMFSHEAWYWEVGGSKGWVSLYYSDNPSDYKDKTIDLVEPVDFLKDDAWWGRGQCSFMLPCNM